MPPSLPAGWTISKRSSHSGGYPQLDALGLALGFPARGAAALEFSVNGAACSIALSINSGTVTGLDLTMKAEGPAPASGPRITLRPETAFDRASKERGIAREVQLGDQRFDAAVYVDSNATDDEVKRVLSAPAVRSAVEFLLSAGAEDFCIDPDGVKAHWKESPERYQPQHVLSLLQSLLVVQRAGRPRGPVVSPPGAWLGVVLITLLLPHGGAFLIANSRWDVPWQLLATGACLGLFGSFFLIGPATRVVSGASDSHRSAVIVTLALLFHLPVAGALGALVLNCGLDGSEGQRVSGTVQNASAPGDGDGQQVEVRWDDGRTETFYRASSSWDVGSSAAKTIHPGSLGVEWSWGLEHQ